MSTPESPLAEQIVEHGITTVVANVLAANGSSVRDDLVGTVSDLYELFDFQRFVGVPEWKRIALAERANSTVWNEERRNLESAAKQGGEPVTAQQKAAQPWRIPNNSHIGQVWLTVDNDPRADRVWAYHLSDGTAALLLVQDVEPDPSADFGTFAAAGVHKVADSEEAELVLRQFREAVNVTRERAMSDLDDLFADDSDDADGDDLADLV